MHDLGGMHGFCAVQPEPDEPVFHAPWERRVFGMYVGVRSTGIFNVDEARFGIESLHPQDYLAASYYEQRLLTMEKNLIAKGLLTRAELDARTREYESEPAARPPERRDAALTGGILAAIRSGASRQRAETGPARYRAGDAVRARNIHPSGHTRLPRYLRGRRGTIERVYGVFVLPDALAHGRGEQPEHMYCVRFAGRELWGESAEPREVLYADLFERYLEPASADAAGTAQPG
jgi:nitrile hydratase subunit beta